MRKLLTLSFLSLLSFEAALAAAPGLRFFDRPVSCPLRFSELTTLRDQVQSLTAALGPECAKNGGAAINQLNSNVANLEGITNSFNSYSSGDAAKTDAQYAKNLNQILGSLNVITSNTSCFYDIRSRGLLPVVSDVIMSVSQFGLLVTNSTGMAAGGYVVGSGLKIVNEMVKKRFNFNRPEDRRSFLQLNCAFFDNRRVMEESGIFDLSTPEYRDQLALELRREKAELIKTKNASQDSIAEMEKSLFDSINILPGASERNLNPYLLKSLETIARALSQRPGDYAAKTTQVMTLSRELPLISEELTKLELAPDLQSMVQILNESVVNMLPDLETRKKAWAVNIDDWEMHFRGPLMAFIVPVTNALRQEILSLETELAITDSKGAHSLSTLKNQIKLINDSAWALNLRISSLEAKINNLSRSSGGLFSSSDTGTTNEVEILDYYRKLQTSILGKEGKGYLTNTIRSAYQMEEALDRQVTLFSRAAPGNEKCASAEKLRFAWSQFRYKVQEAHDFVSTNIDLYRSSFRVGKEKTKKDTLYVLSQIESVEELTSSQKAPEGTVGDLMQIVERNVGLVEPRLHASGCF